MTALGQRLIRGLTAFRDRLRDNRTTDLTRHELRFVTYGEADRLILADPRWTIAPEEDHNRCIGMVYIRRRLTAPSEGEAAPVDPRPAGG